jgi:membrane protease YdiL (CAAX protease family)
MNLLEFKKIGPFSARSQIFLLVTFFVAIAFFANFSFQNTGEIFGYPRSYYLEILFAPIYEEIIFRGVILSALLRRNSRAVAIFFTSFLFGIWHLKNIFFLDFTNLSAQIFYTGFIFGPILGFLVLKFRTIWPGAIFHFANNLVAFAFLNFGIKGFFTRFF